MNKGTVALSSLTMGASAAALLGVSHVSEAEDPGYCDLNFNHCYIGTYPMYAGWEIYGDPYAWGHPNVEAWITYISSYFTQQFNDFYGHCSMQYIAGYPDLKCGCSGTVSQYVVGFIIPNAEDPSTWSLHFAYENTPVFQLHDSQCWYPD